jgi:hypothetical protein
MTQQKTTPTPQLRTGIALITSTTKTNKHGTNKKHQHTVEFSKNKHTPSPTTKAEVRSGITLANFPVNLPGPVLSTSSRSRRLIKLSRPSESTSPRPRPDSQNHLLAERFDRCPAGRRERYGPQYAEVKSACPRRSTATPEPSPLAITAPVLQRYGAGHAGAPASRRAADRTLRASNPRLPPLRCSPTHHLRGSSGGPRPCSQPGR